MLKIIYLNGATQLVQPKMTGREEERFDMNWTALASHIAEGRPHTYVVINL